MEGGSHAEAYEHMITYVNLWIIGNTCQYYSRLVICIGQLLLGQVFVTRLQEQRHANAAPHVSGRIKQMGLISRLSRGYPVQVIGVGSIWFIGIHRYVHRGSQ